MEDKFAIIVSQFNEMITEKLLKGSLSRLQELGIMSHQINVFRVPGAIEIPLIAQQLAKSKRYQAIVCLGAIIRGETGHYNYVCEQVSEGCQRVMLDWEVPVIFGVLTTDNIQQAEERTGGKEGHKGRDAADTAVSMTALMRDLQTVRV